MSKRNTIIISVSLILFTILTISFLNRQTSNGILFADKGIILADNWDYHKGMIKIGGEWEFYPDLFIYPDEEKDVFAEYSDDVRFVQVPYDWNKYIETDRPKKNIGTYRVKITLPYDGSFGIKTSEMSYAYTVYINGKKVCESGKTAVDINDYIPDNQINIGIGSTKSKTLELVVHVSNFKVNTGGVLQAFSLGTERQLIIDKDRNITFDALIVSGYLILGIYFAGCFVQRKKAKYLLYFSLFSVFQGLYNSTINGRMIELIISMPKHMEYFFSFQIHVMYLSVFFFLMFVYDFFKIYVSKKIIIALSILLLIAGPGLIWWPNVDTFSLSITVFQHMLIVMFIFCISYFYIFFSMIKAVYRGAEASGYILLVAVSFSCYAITLGMEIIFNLNIGKVPVVLFLTMLLFISFMMTYTFQLAYEQTDRLTDQLLTYDKMRDRFINKVYLELLKPIGRILHVSESLFSEKDLNGLQKQNILRVKNDCKQIINILEEIKEISGVQGEEANIVCQQITFEEISGMVEDLAYLVLDKKQVVIKNEISASLLPVYADKSKLRQILYHLISNGVKYTTEGEISISAEINENKAYIFVKDSGVGIDKSKWDVIFTSFYHEDTSDENSSSGLGVGLSITRNLLKRLGGEIWVVSELGKGSTFTFTLPLFKGESLRKKRTQETAGESIYAPAAGQYVIKNEAVRFRTGSRESDNYTIMVISDFEPEQKFFIHLLRDMGYGSVVSFAKENIMNLLENTTIDAVIIKAELQGVSSGELCRSIREKYSLAELPIFVLADKGLNEAQAFLSSGVNDYLKKPYETDELKARIHMLLMERKSAVEALNQELNRLQAQIMPHFLYNTLNAIIGLSYKDKEKTIEALQNLSTYFRAKLDFKGYQSFVDLEKEMELMKAYLSIEQMRYGNRLEISYDIDESISLLLPSLTLQPLVENAVQHSISVVNKVQIQIKIYREADNIIINIKDNGPGMSKIKQEELKSGRNQRIGFTNVMNRVKLIRDSQLIVESFENKGTSISIILPEGTR